MAPVLLLALAGVCAIATAWIVRCGHNGSPVSPRTQVLLAAGFGFVFGFLVAWDLGFMSSR